LTVSEKLVTGVCEIANNESLKYEYSKADVTSVFYWYNMLLVLRKLLIGLRGDDTKTRVMMSVCVIEKRYGTTV